MRVWIARGVGRIAHNELRYSVSRLSVELYKEGAYSVLTSLDAVITQAVA